MESSHIPHPSPCPVLSDQFQCANIEGLGMRLYGKVKVIRCCWSIACWPPLLHTYTHMPSPGCPQGPGAVGCAEDAWAGSTSGGASKKEEYGGRVEGPEAAADTSGRGRLGKPAAGDAAAKRENWEVRRRMCVCVCVCERERERESLLHVLNNWNGKKRCLAVKPVVCCILKVSSDPSSLHPSN